MTVTVVRYRTRPERADENQELVEQVFGELHATAPEGLRYASFRLDDGVSFVHVAEVDTDDGANPLDRDAGVRRVPARDRAIAARTARIASDATVVGDVRASAEVATRG